MLLITIIERKLDFAKFKKAIKDTVKLTSTIYLLLAGGSVYGKFFALSRIPAALGNWVNTMSMPGWLVLGIIIVIYLILGCLIDAMPLIMLTIPIFFPIICGTYGYNPIWYGVLLVVVVGMGSITPPVGVNVFILKSIVPDVPIGTIFKGVWPFVIADMAMCFLMLAFPQVIMFLPALF
jgi:TRAP-type C4-dicarboxylate transport system permease large subunit